MIIKRLCHKYSVTSLCLEFGLNRKTFYYKPKIDFDKLVVENAVVLSFDDSRNNYGMIKIKHDVMRKYGLRVCRDRVGRIMKKYGLKSRYNLFRKKRYIKGVDGNAPNIINRDFTSKIPYEKLLSDVVFVRIGRNWHYLCPILDLCGRKIVGSAVGKSKGSELVARAFYSIEGDLSRIKIFHSDHGSEYTAEEITLMLQTFKIQRSLSGKGDPIDNSPAESLNNIIKTEFVKGKKFGTMKEFETEWLKYMKWYNEIRIHGSLEYQTPDEWQMKCAA